MPGGRTSRDRDRAGGVAAAGDGDRARARVRRAPRGVRGRRPAHPLPNVATHPRRRGGCRRRHQASGVRPCAVPRVALGGARVASRPPRGARAVPPRPRRRAAQSGDRRLRRGAGRCVPVDRGRVAGPADRRADQQTLAEGGDRPARPGGPRATTGPRARRRCGEPSSSRRSPAPASRRSAGPVARPAACAVCGGTLRAAEGEIRCVVCEAPGRCATCGATTFGVRRGGAERVEAWASRAARVPVRSG